MADNECRHCVPPKRYPGCHSKCPSYLVFRKELDEKKAEDEKRRKQESLFYEYSRKRRKR